MRSDALTKVQGGLRAVYRTLEPPGKNPLKDAHAALDAAVMDRADHAATERLLGRVPDAQIWLARVGHRATYRLGSAVVSLSPRRYCLVERMTMASRSR